jgi:hypothetical protein
MFRMFKIWRQSSLEWKDCWDVACFSVLHITLGKAFWLLLVWMQLLLNSSQIDPAGQGWWLLLVSDTPPGHNDAKWTESSLSGYRHAGTSPFFANLIWLVRNNYVFGTKSRRELLWVIADLKGRWYQPMHRTYTGRGGCRAVPTGPIQRLA